MRITKIIPQTALLAGLLFAGHAIAAPAAPLNFEGAQWIWVGAENPPALNELPKGGGFFRAAFEVTEKARVSSAELIITADNLWDLYLNGKPVGESDPNPNNWNQPKRFDVAGLLTAGINVLAIVAVNTAPGPAGLLVKLEARLEDGQQVAVATDGRWKTSEREEPNWQQPDFNDQGWRAARVLGDFGMKPWNKFEARAAAQKTGGPRETGLAAPPPDYAWPEAIIFIGDDCSLERPVQHTASSLDSLSVTIFNPRNSRAFPEHDLPAPMKVGRKLYALKPARPGAPPQLLLDAGAGALGSPTVSFDGRWIYFSMAPAGGAFFHIYRLPAAGGQPERITDGPFHDIDPVELPDGRLAFISTRIGRFEEYHNPPARALFVMRADGRDIKPLTHTFIFDNEPEIMADGRLLFIRSDNFFDRGKVETLLHAVHPDGAGGYTEFGLDLGPEYGGRLRAFHCGSPAPLPDGQVAYLTGSGIAVGFPGCAQKDLRNLPLEAGDLAALPDGRLLCTLPTKTSITKMVRKQQRTVSEYNYVKICLVNPQDKEPKPILVFDSGENAIHSPVFLGPRARPPVLADKMDRRREGRTDATGILFCQDARFTKNTTAGWPQVRAIRVLAGEGLTVRSSHSYIVHAGSRVIELGTVPLAPDGSFAVEVPADTAIAFQAVDAEGRSELNEMSWIYVRPGESRGCVGCHQPRQVTPPVTAKHALAMSTPPLRLKATAQSHQFRGNNAAVTGLMEMQFDRYREVAGINRHNAPDPLATGKQEVAELAARLRSGDADAKVSAAQRLAIYRSADAAPALASLLKDASREVRVAAAVALSACGTRDSVSPLFEALEDNDPLVAQAAVMALENLTGRLREFDAFAAPEVRRAQGRAWRQWLETNTWERLEMELVRQLDSGDRDQVRRAAVALGRTGGAAARPALRAYLARERNNNPLPEWRKTHRGDGARFNSLSPVNPRSLQAATRALGRLRDAEAVSLLAETLSQHHRPDTGNLFLAEAAVEALGLIGSPAAEDALITAFAALADYPQHTGWYGDHSALIACHAAPIHYLITEALDAMGSRKTAAIVPHLIRSLPTDPDRALLLENDDCETLVGRVIRRAGAEAAVVETCLAILGDERAARAPEIEKAIAATHQAWGGKPGPENRAAQVLSLVCRDRAYEPRLRAAFERHRQRPMDIPRVFDTGIPVVNKLPDRHWISFFLARALGNLADPRSVDTLVAALDQFPAEAAAGRPDPLGPGVLFLHNDLTPCWRAAAAWALGRIGDRRVIPVLAKTIGNLDNALDTRHAAAEALGKMAAAGQIPELQKLAADYPEVSVRQTLVKTIARLEQPAPPSASAE